MAVFAVGSTIFNIVGPKILGKATTEIFNGLVGKVSGGNGINFGKIGQILLGLLFLYLCSALFSFVQGYIMTGISQKLTYRMRKEISEKINRLPVKYFDQMTHGEILSRITNDVDTLSQSLNQSATQVITSVTTIIGVLVMMISISPLMTLAAILILPISMGFISVIVKHSQRYFKSQQKYLGHVNGQVEEIYSGHNIVKAFNKEEEVIAAFEKDNDILYQSAMGNHSSFPYDDADLAVCRKSGLMWPVVILRWLFGSEANDRSGRYPVIYSVCASVYHADSAGCPGGKYASVHSCRVREGL